MASVSITSLTKRFGGPRSDAVIDDLQLEIPQGELLVLLGASGCGKTTTLRCLAGLESPTSGRIELGGNAVFDGERRIELPAEKRSIGMVFQSYALWPHMTVRKNIAYPLKVRKIKDGLRDGWVEEVADLVDCGHLLDRYPSQLSGGQQQRVALARGIVARPDLVLFDEPLSNLDAKLRMQVRADLHELHERIGFTSVFVTHDQDEALALADRIAIMRSGRIEQCAAPDTVFEEPATDYVAEFMGMSNRLSLTRGVDGWSASGGAPVRLPVAADVDELTVRVRPEHLAIRGGQDVVHGHQVPARVTGTVYGGSHVDVSLEADGRRLQARVETGTPGSRAAAGDRVVVEIDVARARYFDPATERAVAHAPVPEVVA
ncbi:ABC transporter ATP-binding protein [Nocardioides zeae]|uniref:ABC transporter ATP-binding protein n=1 Tax=Nocardioides zeae TaxID=1457234 RepID=A0A6P0HKD4_9ACTN|nr:ABC transporter ATP-binding protein [Nocardioides zeae]NEN79152.1 ABC transporter ATP-binding protein [Nocardioides zeae]